MAEIAQGIIFEEEYYHEEPHAAAILTVRAFDVPVGGPALILNWEEDGRGDFLILPRDMVMRMCRAILGAEQ